MPRFIATFRPLILGAVLAAGAASTHAGFVWAPYSANQNVAVTSAAILNAPPTLETNVANARSGFLANSAQLNATALGFAEFESSSNLGFGYTGGTATLSGSATRIAAVDADWTLGRYNMTAGLPPTSDNNDRRGHWLESSATFSYLFQGSARISAFGFFGTDFGDFDGTVQLQLWRTGSANPLFSRQIDTAPAGTSAPRASDGNLTFFGVVGDTTDDWFDEVRFVLTQTGTGPVDVIGIDSIIVGQSLRAPGGGGSVPTPGTLALAGLALTALGALTRHRARAV